MVKISYLFVFFLYKYVTLLINFHLCIYNHFHTVFMKYCDCWLLAKFWISCFIYPKRNNKSSRFDRYQFELRVYSGTLVCLLIIIHSSSLKKRIGKIFIDEINKKKNLHGITCNGVMPSHNLSFYSDRFHSIWTSSLLLYVL